MRHPSRTIARRQFLRQTGILGAGWMGLSAGLPALLRGEERPAVAHPRATAGDDRSEPDWNERLTISVGPKQGDLMGSSDKVLQAAVDYVARLGGGTVKIQPGVYKLRNAIHLPSNIRLLGSGPDSVLMKEAYVSSKLTEDSDWYDQEITVADEKAFQVGDGITLLAKNPHNSGQTVIKRTVVARSGKRLKLDKGLRENVWMSGEPTANGLFPLLTGEYVENIVLENLALDGNKGNNPNFNGNYGGNVFLQDCRRITMRGVTSRNYNGDGFSWQICHDVLVENCHSHDNVDLGMHPGSGSQRPIMRNNTIERNGLGIFFCWGVKYGLAEKNTIRESKTFGVSIGHCDTDNLVCDNVIEKSGQIGILFRDEKKSFAAHRNRFTRNKVIDSGNAEGIGVDIQGETDTVLISSNEIRESRGAEKRVGIRIGKKATTVELAGNMIQGYAREMVDLRQG